MWRGEQQIHFAELTAVTNELKWTGPGKAAVQVTPAGEVGLERIGTARGPGHQ